MTVRIRLKRQKRRSSFLKSGCSCGGFEAVLRKRTKKKSPENRKFTGLFGGELGIRTLEAFRLTAFRVLHLRPLGQLSVYVIPFSFEKLFARTDGKNNKIFNFRTEQKLSVYGGFEGSILPNSQKISSAAPSTTRTTLRVYFRPVFFPEICSKTRWRENRRDGKKYSILRFSVLRNIKENQGDEIPSFCRNFESIPPQPLRYLSVGAHS